MENQKHVSSKSWSSLFGDYISQYDDYEIQPKKMLKRDKMYRRTFYDLIGFVVTVGYLFILRIVSKI